jgi:hypothetical protein
MTEELLRPSGGRFFRGNLHCHSDRSDGHRAPREVVAAYREAGYDFLMLSDHFEERYGWRVTDTRDLRVGDFTTILGAELSSGDWRDRNALWVAAAGLPLDFDPPPADDPAEAIRRADAVGAFVVLLHPGLNNLPPEMIERRPEFDAVDAVEVFNHNIAVSSHASPDGGYMADEHLERDDSRLHVATSPANAIALGGGGDRWLDGPSAIDERGGLATEAEFELAAFTGSYCRVTVIDADGRRAWSNPVWP